MNSSKSDSESKGDDSTEVHSANSWETADLGDTDRNKKFLRLMGASKKEHHGRFVIGDQEVVHKRPKDDEKQIESELAEQYTQGMEHRLAGGKRGHLGLGYHPDETSEEEKCEKETKDVEEKKDEEDGKDDESAEITSKSEPETNEEKTEKKEERKRENETEGVESDHGIKKMKFVKSSS